MTFNYDVRDNLRSGAQEVPNTVGGNFSVLTFTPELAYRLPRGFAVRLRAPLHWKTFDEASRGIHVTKSGFGDIELLGSYDVLHGSEPHAPTGWRLTATAGLAVPTGPHEVQPFVGEVAPTPLQLGGGTLDPILGLAGQYRLTQAWAVDASGAGRLAIMENRHRYRPASVVEIGIGGEWRPWPERLGLDLHLEWSHVTQVAVAGDAAPNTGRDAVYGVVNVSLHIWRGLAAGVTARIPVYLRVNQTQFAEDFLLGARLTYRTPPLF